MRRGGVGSFLSVKAWLSLGALCFLLAGCATEGPVKTSSGAVLPPAGAAPLFELTTVVGVVDPDTGTPSNMHIMVMRPVRTLQELPPLPTWSCDKSGSLKRARITITYPRAVRFDSDVYLYVAIAPLDESVTSPTTYIADTLITPDRKMQGEDYYSTEGYVTVADELRAKPDDPDFDPSGLGEKSINYSGTTPSGTFWATKVNPGGQGQSTLGFEFHDHSYEDACKDKDILADASLNLLPITIKGPSGFERFMQWLTQGLHWLLALIGALVTAALTTWVTLWVTRKSSQRTRQ